MSDQLTLHTLGGLSVRHDQPLSFGQRKTSALLVYLACNPRPHPREVLAEMLWEDRTQSQSLSNLRVVLTDLRHTVAEHICVTREAVSVNTESDLWLDADAFETRLAAAGDDAAQLEDALALYRGDFLDGFYIDSQGFEDWTLLERERLRFRAMETLDRLIASHLDDGDHAGGIARATQLLRMDTLREKTYRQLMQLLALSGERAAALAQYETCCRMLREELGVTPTPDTVQLYERISAGTLVEARQPVLAAQPVAAEPVSYLPAGPRHNLPVQSTSFVGREDDVTAILDRLAEPDCRLLTLVGPGGMGKTRLALTVAERLVDGFADGVVFVPLAPLAAPDGIMPAIATALDLPAMDTHFHQTQVPAEQQVANFLREKTMLLVLDNCEHVLDGIMVVDRMLATAPDVTVLATSRELLTLGWEWLYEVHGLLRPECDETGDILDYSAIRLFVERGRRVQPAFRLADERAHVITICQLVEGMPLGIEIAAAWLRAMPCDAIAAELLDLESPQRHAPERHRSLRVVFDHTWRHLTALERDTLMRLSIFRGGFTREAAEAVAQSTLPRLATLVNKSLLHCDRTTRRYGMHELLRQYAAEPLESEPDQKRDLLSRYVDYYAAFLQELAPEFQRGRNKTVRADTDNLLNALDWAMRLERLPALTVFLKYLFEGLCLHPTQFTDKTRLDILEPLSAQLEAMPASTERDIALGLTLVSTACWINDVRGPLVEQIQPLLERGLTLLGQHAGLDELALAYFRAVWACSPRAEEMITYCEHSLALWQRLEDEVGIAMLLERMGSLYFRRLFEPQRASALFQQALDIAQQTDNPYRSFKCAANLGNIKMLEGDVLAGKTFYEDGLEYLKSADNAPMHVWEIHNNLAYSYLALNEPEAAERAIRQAFDGARTAGYPLFLPTVYDTWGDINYACGEFSAAQAHYEQALNIWAGYDAYGEERVFALFKLAFAVLAMDDTAGARAYLRQGLTLVTGSGLSGQSEAVPNGILCAALLYAVQREYSCALEWFGVTAACQSPNKNTWAEACLRTQLEAEFGPAAVAVAIERGKDRELFEVAREVLAELERST